MMSEASRERMRERTCKRTRTSFCVLLSRDFSWLPLMESFFCRLSHLMCCSSWIGFIQSSVQCKDISQGNNNSYQCMWKINIVFIFKEIVVRCVDTKLTKVWTGIQVTTFHGVWICVGKALMSPSTLLIQSKLAFKNSHLSSLLAASES